MRVLLIALLAAISYAQTGKRALLELLWPESLELSDDKYEVRIPPDPRHGFLEPIKLQFLEPITANSYGAVFECVCSNGDRIAFKLLKSTRGHRTHVIEHNLPYEPYMNTAEIRAMTYLSQMSFHETLQPKLGTRIHHFTKKDSGTDFYGFGMTLFRYPTILEIILNRMNTKIGCGMVYCIWSRWKVKKNLLFKPIFRNLYDRCLNALKGMWKLGVVHHNMNPDNILYEQASKSFCMSQSQTGSSSNQNF